MPARFEAYSQASKDVFAIFDDTTPLVEGISIDEAFLDVSGLGGSPAPRSRSRPNSAVGVRDDVGLPITVGVARTKFLAKVASGVGKPDGLLRVDPERELDFLHPLPVDKLWGVGAITAAKLDARGIHTVGEVAAMDPAALRAIVGVASGRQLYALVAQRRRPAGRDRQAARDRSARSRRSGVDPGPDERSR